MIVGCVDNLEARQLLEQMGEELTIPFMDAVVADDAMSGSVQLIIPGRTGGLEAAPIPGCKAGGRSAEIGDDWEGCGAPCRGGGRRRQSRLA